MAEKQTEQLHRVLTVYRYHSDKAERRLATEHKALAVLEQDMTQTQQQIRSISVRLETMKHSLSGPQDITAWQAYHNYAGSQQVLTQQLKARASKLDKKIIIAQAKVDEASRQCRLLDHKQDFFTTLIGQLRLQAAARYAEFEDECATEQWQQNKYVRN